MKSTLETIKLTNKEVNVIIDDDIIEKIKFLCSKMPKVEWSGLLFYKIRSGTMSDHKKPFLIDVKDIFLMDKGSAGYTEYDVNQGSNMIMKYYKNNRKALTEKWKVGHVHSHNTMSVYFSSTDMSELEDNVQKHNIYLSLIVNNYLDMCAKVAFYAEQNLNFERVPVITRDEEGNEYILKTDNSNECKRKYMYHVDCNIETPLDDSIKVPDDFLKRYEEVVLLKKSQKSSKTSKNKKNDLFGRSLELPFNKKSNDYVFLDEIENQYYPDNNFKYEDDFGKDTYELVETMLEDIYKDILGLGEKSTKTLYEIFDTVKVSANKNTGSEMCKNFFYVFNKYYNKYFEDISAGDLSYYSSIQVDVASILEIYEEEFPFLKKTLNCLP